MADSALNGCTTSVYGSGQHWRNISETGGAHMGFSERIHTILIRIELRWTITNQPVYDIQPFIVVQGKIGTCPLKIDRVRVKKYWLSTMYTLVEMNWGAFAAEWIACHVMSAAGPASSGLAAFDVADWGRDSEGNACRSASRQRQLGIASERQKRLVLLHDDVTGLETNRSKCFVLCHDDVTALKLRGGNA